MKKLKILYLEDSEHDAEIVGRTLKNEGIDFSVKLVDSQNEYEDALGEYQPDLILADHSLFEFNSVQALKIFKSYNLKIPFILVTGTVSEEFAVNILKEGADDYLLKDNLARLPKAIINALEKFRIDRERQQYLKDIVANESLLKETEKMANIGSWQTDMITGTVKCSDQQNRIYGYEPGEIIPGYETFLSHVHPGEIELVKKAMDEAIESRDSYESEFRIIDKAGNVKYIHSKIVIERNSKGLPTRLAGFNQDITERNLSKIRLNQLNENLQKYAEELESSNIELERFAYIASHDLQEPLRMVSSFMGLLQKKYNDKFDDTARSYIRFAVDGAERMKKLILDLLLFSRVDTHNEAMQMVNCNELMEEVQQDLLSAITESKATIRVNQLPNLRGYKSQLEQLFQNLIGNAIKYRNEKLPLIEISCEEKEKYRQFCVQDNGIGIDPKFFQKIFIIFQRLHNKDDYSGTGIGLAIARKIVERHGGTIWVESEPGQGSSFYFTIAKKIQSQEPVG